MQFRRQVKAEESVNLTPLIDVVFLLLIFFMVSTTFTKETHLKVDLPEAVGDKQPAAASKIEVVVGPQGGYAINGKSLVNSQVDTLRRAVEELSSGDNSIPFIITGDSKAPYQSVVTVMDLAGQMGFAKLSMTTRMPSDSEDSGEK
ncbi:biopolymer transporter ExbD [Teredinibacter sp. KSP-S5-2]|uniref:ExbD/TolR family protein n=1 Tax=Teredinibacter sp. KSP-S5-2 TaxID=3034506 RepID=UPI002934FDAC|nr:biopolymer transporter ExbD [Teredinibacter sp. KSP-S5-2]WNO11258.1 biopolymer transporter ExbD [Teredinibacter sp. KSP-S5-2]